MRKALDYSQYNYLICFNADEDNSTFITGSSNRAIVSKYLLSVNEFISETEGAPHFDHCSTLLECFELLSKEKDRLLENEKARLVSIRQLFKRIKEGLLEEYGMSLETAQLLFVMPLGWTEEHYKDKLRAFFLDVGWITPKDNVSKLIIIPFVQVLAERFQEWNKKPLDRERTSVLFSLQRIYGEDRVEFSYTFFKMQSAKELISVSKRLASSDFLLVPSIGITAFINLPCIEDVIYNAVKEIIARIRIQSKDPKSVSGKNTAKEDDIARAIACRVFDIQFDLLQWGHQTLKDYSSAELNFEEYQLRDLGKWTCDQLIAAIYEDANVKHYLKQVCGFFKGALDDHGATRNSPDGIQHTLLYIRDFPRRVEYTSWVRQALVKEDIIQPGDEFLRGSAEGLAKFAMQQSYKMIQIAHTILPPVIVNDEKRDDYRLSAFKPTSNLIAPNSFYVQANVTETQISFILNKVIEATSSKTGIDLFTVQERSVEIEDIAETASYLLWNHYQSMVDLKKHQHGLFECCQGHNTMVLLSSQFKEFKENARKLINSWFATENSFSEEGLDAYRLVSVDQQCACALKLSQRLLLEVGLRPAIANIATTITSTLFSDDFFGLYQLSALILQNNWNTIKDIPFLCAIDGLLKRALGEFLHLHHNRLLLLFQDKCANSNVSQYLGHGNYSQVSSKGYIFRFTVSPFRKDKPILGLLEGGICKKLPLTLEGGITRESRFELNYPGLDLPVSGDAHTCIHIDLETYVSEDFNGGTPSQHQMMMGSMALYSVSTSQQLFAFSLKILPMHYSSILKITASTVSDYSGKLSMQDESVNVLERLSLKKKSL
ncbi:hypothetical protein MBANPS3_000719 [Mucor bainieri]